MQLTNTSLRVSVEDSLGNVPIIPPYKGIKTVIYDYINTIPDQETVDKRTIDLDQRPLVRALSKPKAVFIIVIQVINQQS